MMMMMMTIMMKMKIIIIINFITVIFNIMECSEQINVAFQNARLSVRRMIWDESGRGLLGVYISDRPLGDLSPYRVVQSLNVERIAIIVMIIIKTYKM